MIRLKEWKIKPTVWDIYKMTDFIRDWNHSPNIRIGEVELSFQKQRDEFSLHPGKEVELTFRRQRDEYGIMAHRLIK